MTGRWRSWLQSDRSTRAILWGTLGLLLSVLVLVVVLFVSTRSIRSDTAASRRSDELGACRGLARADVDAATFAWLDAFSDVQTAQSDAVAAAIRQDPQVLDRIAGQIDTAEAAKADAWVALMHASDAYGDTLVLSREDPDRFLTDCKAAA